MYKVTCGSTVDHMICFDCEKQWREKMPIRDGDRKMTCPTCRQPETSRDAESLQREVKALYASRQAPSEEWRDALRVILRLTPNARAFVANHLLSTVQVATAPAPRATTRPPPRVFCASGRNCYTTSQVNSRTKTHLKCRSCNVVACCANCRHCTRCRPLPSSAPSSAPLA